ncbi:Gtr1/RagA G protein Gtr1 [Cryptococcus wingfieldii CBS 7118]|uniref:GTP-binding protein n=1 Tax=Cryptococcus wingfieldii CBS 7118 TaxID=1295528 RepID=A0A1E3JER4_9TREE|nr:Gtr1/RagA G protein Gtr1 [Cryptococcus wingfieldii CBS 7118]ODN99378.1 Gtr1/RagA G protein Gtr1 [Cryptococcus wingfieldii CBS 7118]
MAQAARKKVLLMGKSGSGKTSMRSVIFSNYSAKDTRRLGATIDVEQSAVRFLGGLVLNLWDCGGQSAFVDNYLSSQKDTIFSNVAVLIYVFDNTTPEWESDLSYFEEILLALRENSPDAGVWCLINKMDLTDKEDPKRRGYEQRKEELGRVDARVGEETGEGARGVRCYPTSIWDETLYKASPLLSVQSVLIKIQAWSSIIHTLIPNISLITSHLTYLRDLCLSVEAVLFEAETFLVIAKSGSPLDCDPSDLDQVEMKNGVKELDAQRFEKISEIIKGFRKVCQRNHEQYQGFECKFEDCTVVLEPLTRNTFILLISTDPRTEPGLMLYNIHQAQGHMAEFGGRMSLGRKCGLCEREGGGEGGYVGDQGEGRAWDDAEREDRGVVW